MSFKETSEQLFNSCVDAFGEEIVILFKDNDLLITTGIFTHEYQLIQEPGMDSSISTGISMIEVPLAGMEKPPVVGGKAKIRSQNYTIVEVRPNHEGQVKLILKKTGVSNEQKKFNKTRNSTEN